MIKPVFYLFLAIVSLVFTPVASSADQQEQRRVNREIKRLANSLESTKEASDKLHREITDMEKKLGRVANQEHQTEKKIKVTTRKLRDAIKQRKVLQSELDIQRDALAQQLQALYSAGEQSHLRLLLRQDDPSDMSRTMKYFEYMNNSRVSKIKKAEAILAKVKKTEAAIQKEQLELKSLTKQLDEQKRNVKQLLTLRSQSLKKLERDISGKQKRLDRLQTQDEHLQTVVNQVAKKTQIQKKVPEKLADNKQVDESTAIVKGRKVKTHTVPNKRLTQLKGALSWPVDGRIIHNYGSKRNRHQKWKGVVLAAPGGTKVRAIAKGDVVFSDWMDGYGYLIIIQHDSNYLSLYGYNRSVYKKEGSKVKANEVIAAVGNSGGQSQHALYFEIRKGRKPQNPKLWFK